MFLRVSEIFGLPRFPPARLSPPSPNGQDQTPSEHQYRRERDHLMAIVAQLGQPADNPSPGVRSLQRQRFETAQWTNETIRAFLQSLGETCARTTRVSHKKAKLFAAPRSSSKTDYPSGTNLDLIPMGSSRSNKH